MGSIVNKLGLFEKTNCDSISNASTTQNIYKAPVQVFNGPVFFGGSPQSFFQGGMNKRHLDMPLIKMLINFVKLSQKKTCLLIKYFEC